ncbi:oxidoreductase-like protein [Mycena haematopus]|nr:oxidoreductase-like protein [Mycena haematopus]KAJ7245661.1 oxidoreductase-like protein [Mycena haematopus]
MFAITCLRRHGLYFHAFSLPRYFALDAGAIERLKNPTRGGQNLSVRYRRLEQSLRGKEALQRDILQRGPGFKNASPTTRTSEANYFRGLKIPQQPKPPQSDECCMSGCAICVYDLYEDSLSAYHESMAAFRLTLTSSGIPEESWPESVRAGDTTVRAKPVTMSAFEELERSLKAKRDAASQ